MRRTCWAAVALNLAFFAIESQAEPCCRPEPERTLQIDLDGDGVPDTIHSVYDSGSGMSTRAVELVLSHTGKRIEVNADFSFTTMVSATAIPPELLAPGTERALQAVETALFGCVCQSPDPSFGWLLEKGPRSLRWIAGAPSLPDNYTLRQEGEWLSYAGYTHRGLTRKATEPEIKRLATDPGTGYVLARTAHGVLLIDEKGSRHAWLYVTRDGAGQKLRFPTVVGGRLKDGQAIIRLSHEWAFYGTYECGLLRIDLREGTFSERWRDLESAGAAMEPCWAELDLPDQDFTHPPERPHDPGDFFFTFDQLDHYYRVPGEFTHRLTGDQYGFEALSFIITETHPGGGPGLHVHDTEEAHILLEGSVQYRIGDKTLIVQGPYEYRPGCHTRSSTLGPCRSTSSRYSRRSTQAPRGSGQTL
jgi:hypothetical protein